MPPKEKTKRTLTPDQLEKLAVARAKANEVRIAMKEGREDAQVAALQAKMNVLKAKKKQKDIIPTVPEEPPEMTSVATPDEETDPDKEEKIAKQPAVEPVPEPEPTQAGPPEKLQCKKKKTKKPIVIVQNSESDSDSDDSNVIYIKKSSRKKKPEHVPPPQPPPPRPPPAQYHRPMPSNPFFNPMFSYGSRNFQ